MKLTPEVARTVARKLGYVTNGQADDIEIVLGKLVRGEANTVEEAIELFHKEFGEEEDDY